MPKLGDLFIELGVAGDVKELEKAVRTMKEQAAITQTQVKLDNARAKALEKIRQATTKVDKQKIAKAYNTEKQGILEQAQVAGLQRQINAQKALKSELMGVVRGFAAFAGAVAGAAFAINKLTNDLVQTNQAFLNLTRTSDISLSTFQKWDSVGKMFGIQNAAQQLEGLNERLFDLRLTGQGARGFQLAGIDPRGLDAEGVLEQLRDRVSTLDDTSASYLLKQMGLDPQMLHLLRMGREEFQELGETMRKYQLTEDQRKDIQKMNIQLQIAAQKLQYLKDRAVLAIMPAFVKLVQSFTRVTEMLIRFTKKLGQFLIKWRSVIAGLALGLSKIKAVSLVFSQIGTALGACITKIPLLGRAFAAFGGIVAKALLPLTALYLLLDDFAVYKNGGDSVIGDFMEWKDQQGADWGDIRQTFKEGNIGQGIKDIIIKLVVTLDDFIQEAAKWLHVMTGIPFDKLTEALAQFLSQGTITQARNYDYTHGIVTGGAANIVDGYEGTLPNIAHRGIVSGTTEQAITNNSTANNTSNNTTISQNIQIETNQPAHDIQAELAFVQQRYAFG